MRVLLPKTILFAPLFLILSASLPSSATVLTFNVCGGGTGTAVEGNRCRYATINQDYGDRVTGASMNGGRMQYGEEGEGWTPNITTTYGPDGTAIRGWDNNYAGLWTVIWTEDRSGLLSIRFTADPGHRALFYGLRVGAYIFNGGPWPLVVGSLSVTNDTGATLWSQTNLALDQSDPFTLAFASPLMSGSGGWIEFLMDVRNLPVGNANRESIGVDLVRFGQISNPEPGTMSMMLLGGAGLAFHLLRKRRKGQSNA